jgi:hypothetical protein
MLDNRQLLRDECTRILPEMQGVTHETMGSLMVHTGTHPVMGDIVIVASKEQDSVLIHGWNDLPLR